MPASSNRGKRSGQSPARTRAKTCPEPAKPLGCQTLRSSSAATSPAASRTKSLKDWGLGLRGIQYPFPCMRGWAISSLTTKVAVNPT
eukprot:2521655-Amphidinium_carterae.1